MEAVVAREKMPRVSRAAGAQRGGSRGERDDHEEREQRYARDGEQLKRQLLEGTNQPRSLCGGWMSPSRGEG